MSRKDYDINFLCMQMVVGKVRVYDGVVNRHAGFDLMLFDCQENLPVPGISIPVTNLPPWNVDKEYDMINMAAYFADIHLQDHGCMVVFHSWSVAAKEVIAGICESYPTFVVKKEWMGMNRVHLTSPLDTSNTVSQCLMITNFFTFTILS